MTALTGRLGIHEEQRYKKAVDGSFATSCLQQRQVLLGHGVWFVLAHLDQTVAHALVHKDVIPPKSTPTTS